MNNRSWTVTIEEDPKTGEAILPLPNEMIKGLGWQDGDILEWIDNKDGSWNLVKKEDKMDK